MHFPIELEIASVSVYFIWCLLSPIQIQVVEVKIKSKHRQVIWKWGSLAASPPWSLFLFLHKKIEQMQQETSQKVTS